MHAKKFFLTVVFFVFFSFSFAQSYYSKFFNEAKNLEAKRLEGKKSGVSESGYVFSFYDVQGILFSYYDFEKDFFGFAIGATNNTYEMLYREKNGVEIYVFDDDGGLVFFARDKGMDGFPELVKRNGKKIRDNSYHEFFKVMDFFNCYLIRCD